MEQVVAQDEKPFLGQIRVVHTFYSTVGTGGIIAIANIEQWNGTDWMFICTIGNPGASCR